MTAIAAEQRVAPITHRQVLVVFSGLVLAMLLAALDSTIVSTALPTIVGELGGLAHLSWVVTAYLLAQTVVTPLYGKLGDLYGRKGVLQAAIVLFLVGSVLCGMSRSMTELIVFRAIQGFGGGGLMVTTQAVVGDVVPPRDRGRYQGLFGAVFGVASVAGPLLGGYFTTELSWRWIFYVNLPVGLVALAVLAATLPTTGRRARHAVDYAGAATLAAALAAIVLACDLGGTAYAWDSPFMIGLVVAAVVALGAFLAVESRAAEPVLPLRLFANRAFAVASSVGFIVGFALFGSVTYLPIYLQTVKGASPTESGLEMLPMMGGMLVTSIASGQLISRFGRYKIFPVVGTAVGAAGLFLLSRLDPASSHLYAAGAMLVLGLGLGLVMQVLVIAVQNAVDYRDLGVATSGATLFRLVGGSFGTAALGAIFAARIASRTAELPAGAPDAHAVAMTAAVHTIFLVATAVALAGFALAWLLPERPLRRTVGAASEDVGTEMGQAFAMPTDGEAATEILRGLAVLADRDVRRRHIASIVTRAGLDLTPAAAWLLVRLEADPGADLGTLSRAHRIESGRLDAALAELVERDYVSVDGGRRELTDDGCAAFDRLVAARRARLEELFADWAPERRADLAAALTRLARDLVPEHRSAA
jgi:EmrB/QacA subfamily drug resistance transporter